MSTDFRPLDPIRMADLFDGRLESAGVHEKHSDGTTSNSRCLTDGRNFLWVYGDEEGIVSAFTRYSPNGAPQRILRAIDDEFDTDIVSEYEPQFGGSTRRRNGTLLRRKLRKNTKRNFTLSF